MRFALCSLLLSLPQGLWGRSSSLLGFVAMRYALCALRQ